MFKKLTAVILAAVMLLSMCACGSNPILGNSDEDEPVYQKTNSVNLAINHIKTLNPLISSDEDTYHLTRLIYQSLFVLDDKLKPEGDLAESYKVSEDRKSVTVTLDRSAHFSDGDKVTAADVIFSIEAFKKAGKKSAYYGNVKNIVSYRKLSSSKVKVTFKKYGGGISRLTFPILPSHGDSIDELKKLKSDFRPLGSGQYKVSKYVKDESLVLKPNKEYAGDVAENTLKFTVYPKNSDLLNLMSGNIVSFLVRTDRDRHSDIGCTDLRSIEFASNKLLFAGFNTKRISSDKVRKAICSSIDTSTLLKKQYYGSGVIANSLFYPGYLGIEKDKNSPEFSRKDAKELLEQAGWKDRNKDGFLENDKKEKVEITIAVSEDRKKTAEFVADELEKSELKSRVVTYPKKKFVKALKKGKFDMYIGEMTFADYYDLTDIIGGKSDYANCSDNLVNLARKANRCMKPEELVSCNQKLMRKLNEEADYFPMIYITYSCILSDELEGEASPLFNNIYRGCSSWTSSYVIDNSQEGEKE